MKEATVKLRMNINLLFMRYFIIETCFTGGRGQTTEFLTWNRPWWTIKQTIFNGKIIWRKNHDF